MPMIEPISEQTIRSHIVRAVQEVFSTMLGREVQFVDPPGQTSAKPRPALEGKPGQHDPYVVGTVGFVGKIDGLIYLYLPEKFARLATSHLLGMSEYAIAAEGASVVNDAIGELTNMTVGVFKNALCDSGLTCRLTIPSILRGSNFTIEPISSATRWIFHFDCAGYRLVADILMKPQE